MRASWSRAGAALLAFIAVCACASPGPSHVGRVPHSPAVSGPVTKDAYRIQAGDELEVRFFHTPEQNVILPVRPDGMISLPLAYEIRAAGRTPEELRQDLVERYSRELVKPEIAVIVRTVTGFQVHVGGEVDKPGVLELPGPRTVLQAVFQAGGLLTTASPENAIIVRRQDDGGYEVLTCDLEAVLEGEDASGNILLQAFDVVYIPRSRIAEVNKWVDLYIRQNIPISFSYRFENP